MNTPLDVRAPFFEIVEFANAAGWYLLNMCQLRTTWRVTLQRRGQGGVSQDRIEFADDPDPRLAMLAAFRNAMTRDNLDKGGKPVKVTTPPVSQNGFTAAQEKRLDKALDALWFAVKTNGSRSKDRADTLRGSR